MAVRTTTPGRGPAHHPGSGDENDHAGVGFGSSLESLDIRQVSARHIDAANGTVTDFEDPSQVRIARSLAQVRPAIEAAERAAVQGRFVVGYVAYEAAPAFDSAMDAHEAEPGRPLAAFIEFERRTTRPWTPTCETRWEGGIKRRGGTAWYTQAVEEVRHQISKGDVYQVNVTDRIDLEGADDIGQLFEQLVAAQLSSSNWLIDLGETVIASASPELFFCVDSGVATTRPMKGTARRGARPLDDEQQAAALLASEKQRAENVMIVDLLRNDLSRVSVPGGVTVPHLFEIERYPTVWQMTSTVSATLRPETSLVDVFAALFPCGSVTGAPKVAAMASIRQLEPWPRDAYCGAIGIVEPGDGLTCSFDVAIRTAVADRRSGRVTFGSGGGITWDSNPLDEDAELTAKTMVLTSPSPDFGLIETFFVDTDGPRHLERHLARLADSATYFGLEAPIEEIRRALEALHAGPASERGRIVLNRNGTFTVEASTFVVECEPVRLAISSTPTSSTDPMRCHKVTDRAFYEQALARFPDADDVILINERDEVVESCKASIVYRIGDRWWTPPLSSGGLNGIGRNVLIDAGTVHERVLPLAELGSCDELGVVSSLRGLRNAALIDGAAGRTSAE
jgi:para-aminobenzoate synthetase / 4-amino-4-deoxychorismate lyase